MRNALASELNVLANILSRIALSNRHTCDFTTNSLRSALAEVIASFPVYRTYVNGREVSPEDRRYIELALAAGRRRSNAADLSVFDFIRSVLLLEQNGDATASYKRAIQRFAMKFQQVTAAVMAKGVEDTAFYRYHRLVSLNEVGGDPRKFATSIAEFHRTNQERMAGWPHAMLCSSTHDSKRSEDVRARINVLSEIPALWRQQLRRWRDWNQTKKRTIDGQCAPTRNDEYLLYQTLAGMWPFESLDDARWKEFTERIEQYMLKAAREAKEHTSWANTNVEYEGAISAFVRAVLNQSPENRFLAEFEEFQRGIARTATLNSLSQCLLKLTSPGVPDIYQGNEVWQFSLVDPDNRSPIDYELRKRLLQELRQRDLSPSGLLAHVRELTAHLENGKAKLFLTWKTLNLRKTNPELFQRGSYVPLTVSGNRSEHVVAFAREHEGRTVMIAVPRLCASLLSENRDTICDEMLWEDTRVELIGPSPTCFHNFFTGECIPAQTSGDRHFLPFSKLFRHFPAVLLVPGALNA